MIRTQFCTVQLKVEKDAPGIIDLAEHLFALGGLHDHPQEIFWVIPYDSQMRIRRIVEVARGGYHSMDIPIPAVMSAVLLAAADRFAVAHNHSTGDVTPTVADLDLTGKLMAAANTLGLYFEDHVIVGPNFEEFSMADAGIITPSPALSKWAQTGGRSARPGEAIRSA